MIFSNSLLLNVLLNMFPILFALFRVAPKNPRRNVNDKNGMPQQATMKKRESQLPYRVLHLVAKVGLPAFYILFCIIFFVYGILNTEW